MNNSIACFLHIAKVAGYNKPHEEILQAIWNSGLINHVDEIHLGCVGTDEIKLPYKDKIYIHELGPLSEGEVATVRLMQEYCLNNPSAIIFKCHNSGLKQVITGNVDQKYPWWRYWQIQWMIHNYKKCLELLGDNDIVGIEYSEDPSPHFGGSWYWTTATYMNQLPRIDEIKGRLFGEIPGSSQYNWHCVEFLPGLGKGKMKSIKDTGYHWGQRLEAVNKVIKPYFNEQN